MKIIIAVIVLFAGSLLFGKSLVDFMIGDNWIDAFRALLGALSAFGSYDYITEKICDD